MKKLCSVILAISMLFDISVFVSAKESTEEYLEDNNSCLTGDKPLTDEELEHFMQSTPKIVAVKPNSLFYERVSAEFSESFSIENISNSIVDYGQEFVCDTSEESNTLMETSTMILPSFVDNSAEDTFPVIGNQGDLGACVGWSYGYYQLTNNANLIRGTAAKSQNGNIPEKVYSPNWLYNLGNGGEDAGMNVIDVSNVLYTYGCPTIDNVPLKNREDQYLTWYPFGYIWEKALYNKCDTFYGKIETMNSLTPVTGSDKSCLNGLKSVLANGYVVCISTYTNTTTKKGYTKNNVNEYVWTEVVVDFKASHSMAIVGYDDNFKVDINGNGIFEAEEYGAFKVANSWGNHTNYHNFGFIWISYDALNRVSSIADSNSVGRVPAFSGYLYYLVLPQKQYQPLLTASVTINTRYRHFLRAYIGIEEVANPQNKAEIQLTKGEYLDASGNVQELNGYIAFGHEGNMYNLNGGSGYGTGTVTFDFSPLLQKFELEENHEYNVYLKMEDVKVAGLESVNKVTLESFILKDHYTGETYKSDDVPVSTSSTLDNVKVGVKYTSSISSATKDKIFTIAFNSNVDADTVNNENLKVVDSENNNVPINLSVDDLNKSVNLSFQNKMHSGFYLIRVLNGLKSKGGNGLSRIYEKEFYVPFH